MAAENQTSCREENLCSNHDNSLHSLIGYAEQPYLLKGKGVWQCDPFSGHLVDNPCSVNRLAGMSMKVKMK